MTSVAPLGGTLVQGRTRCPRGHVGTSPALTPVQTSLGAGESPTV
jgi:hypothetical protein